MKIKKNNGKCKSNNSIKDILNQNKQENKLCLNSGRSIGNKRFSHDISYHTQNLRNNNKYKVIVNNQNSSIINHRILLNEEKEREFKQQKEPDIYFQVRNDVSINMKKNNKGIQEQISAKANKNKNKSLQSSMLFDKFQSENTREPILIKSSRIPISSHRINSQDKQNNSYASNILLNSSKDKFKTMLKNPANITNNNLNFVIQKSYKDKNNILLNKKKLLLNTTNTDQDKLKAINQIKGNTDIKKSSEKTKSKNKNKILSKSKQNKSKQNFEEHLTTKDTFQSSYHCQHLCQQSHFYQYKNEIQRFNCHRAKQIINNDKKSNNIQKNQRNKNYLKLKSPNIDHHVVYQSGVNNQEITKQEIKSQNPSIKCVQDEHSSTFSIKSLLKILNSSANNDQNQIKKILRSLTYDKNSWEQDNLIPNQYLKNQLGTIQKQVQQLSVLNQQKQNDKNIPKQSHQKQQQSTQTSIYNILIQNGGKTANFEQNQVIKQEPIEVKGDISMFVTLIKRYQLKISDLFEQLIKQKQQRYKLQEIIQKYIYKKQTEVKKGRQLKYQKSEEKQRSFSKKFVKINELKESQKYQREQMNNLKKSTNFNYKNIR